MARWVAYFLILIGLCLFSLPAVQAEEAEWDEARVRIQPIRRGELVSPASSPQMVSMLLDLPGKDGQGFKVKIEGDKVLVDVNQSGKPDFRAAQGVMSKPFPLKLHYSDGEVVEHMFKVAQVKGGWALVRQSYIEARIGRTYVWFVDENNNGIYGEERVDGIFVDRKEYGAPYSNVIFVEGELYEVRLNSSGTELKYRPYTGPVGKVEPCENFGGKKSPEAIIVTGECDAGAVYFDVATRKDVVLPEGDYRIHVGYMENVTIDCSNAKVNFTVKNGTTAQPSWCEELKMTAQAQYNKKTKKLMLIPLPKVVGSKGENIIGDYMDDGRFKISVVPCTANGDPVARATNWSKTGIGGGG
ncbi:MAG: hypothetical protein U5N86_02405 [Planctomycetota bacterium]|nr:hypothetical protein [Planctomycetota bacterium]